MSLIRGQRLVRHACVTCKYGGFLLIMYAPRGRSSLPCFPLRKGGREGQNKFPFVFTPPSPRTYNDQSLTLLNFEGLVFLSPSEITRELCELMITISQGVDRHEVPVVGKNGKLNETIESSGLGGSR